MAPIEGGSLPVATLIYLSLTPMAAHTKESLDSCWRRGSRKDS